tara:strand:+ start:43 stop:414 length:372 start_codon:yes stop_codon:yes gene_type:complete
MAKHEPDWGVDVDEESIEKFTGEETRGRQSLSPGQQVVREIATGDAQERPRDTFALDVSEDGGVVFLITETSWMALMEKLTEFEGTRDVEPVVMQEVREVIEAAAVRLNASGDTILDLMKRVR